MSGERNDWFFLFRATRVVRSVATILRRVNELLLVHCVEAVGPAKVVTLVHLQQFLSRILRLVIRAWENLRPVLAELVATVLGGKEFPSALTASPITSRFVGTS